jgi:hypothetical protein
VATGIGVTVGIGSAGSALLVATGAGEAGGEGDGRAVKSEEGILAGAEQEADAASISPTTTRFTQDHMI